MNKVILVIDQGTTSSRAVIFDEHLELVVKFQKEFDQSFPKNNWVEHDVDKLWDSVEYVLYKAEQYCIDHNIEISALGITNQRETTVVWEKETGNAIYPAIVWQDGRTEQACQKLRNSGSESEISQRSGLCAAPYFSATKVSWILENVEGARASGERGELAFGTIDSYLIARLTRLKHHLSDVTNASRTCLFNIHNESWDKTLLALFDIPEAMLPRIQACDDNYGYTEIANTRIPILAVAGDQQAAAIGHGCLTPGEAKATFGTGCFLMVNTGSRPVLSNNRLLTTIAYNTNGHTSYAIEGSVFMAGATIQWCRDSLGIVDHASECEGLAKAARDDSEVILVPAFAGLGAPYWMTDAKAALMGMTRASGKCEIVRAALESVSLQTHDLVESIKRDGIPVTLLNIDGGMAINDWFAQDLANTLNITVHRPKNTEATSLGVARICAKTLGWQEKQRKISGDFFYPNEDKYRREVRLNRWKSAITCVTKHIGMS